MHFEPEKASKQQNVQAVQVIESRYHTTEHETPNSWLHGDADGITSSTVYSIVNGEFAGANIVIISHVSVVFTALGS